MSQRYQIFYDGNCSFCTDFVHKTSKAIDLDVFEFLNFHHSSSQEKFPKGVTLKELDAEMHIYDTKKEIVYKGAAAIGLLLSNSKGKKLLGYCVRFLTWVGIGKLAYKYVASKRYKFVGTCKEESCQISR